MVRTVLAVVKVTANTAAKLSTRQTPAASKDDESRLDHYLAHWRPDRPALPRQVRYWVTDGYYRNQKFIDGVAAFQRHQIGKLRHGANRRWLYPGEPQPRGCQRRYNGKVTFEEFNRFEPVGTPDGLHLDTAIINRAHFQRHFRIVYLVKRVGNKVQTAWLVLTDRSWCAQT